MLPEQQDGSDVSVKDYDDVLARWQERAGLTDRESVADTRTRPQRWADAATAFSGSWGFIGLFVGFCCMWVYINVSSSKPLDPYPFLFLNWLMTVVSTLQSPLILLSQNRQNEMDRERDQRAADDVAALRREVAELKDLFRSREHAQHYMDLLSPKKLDI